jgi:hypothetical protein
MYRPHPQPLSGFFLEMRRATVDDSGEMGSAEMSSTQVNTYKKTEPEE